MSKRGIEIKMRFEKVCAATFAETAAVLTHLDDGIFILFFGLNLGDSPDGEIRTSWSKPGGRSLFVLDEIASRRNGFSSSEYA